jgi:hypothetical protein
MMLTPAEKYPITPDQKGGDENSVFNLAELTPMPGSGTTKDENGVVAIIR